MSRLRTALFALAALAPCIAVTAHAQTRNQLNGTVVSDAPVSRPVHISTSLTNSLGSGTFNMNPSNPTFGTTLTVSPFLAYGPWFVNVTERASIEWTQDDGATYSNQISLSDLQASVRYTPLRLPDLNLVSNVNLAYSLPLSLASRAVGSAGAVSSGATVAWAAPSVGFGAYGRLSGGWTFLVPALAARYASQPVAPYQDRSLGQVSPVACNPRNDVEVQNYVCTDGSLPSVARWGIGLGANQMVLSDQVQLSLDLTYGQGFSVRTGPDDTYTADNAVAGLVPRQNTSANLSATWSPMQWLNLTAGVFSGQPLFGADGSTPRFPLWDFVSPYNNFSSLYVDLTATL